MNSVIIPQRNMCQKNSKHTGSGEIPDDRRSGSLLDLYNIDIHPVLPSK